MGKALAEAALDAGHQVVIVTGPVELTYPASAEAVPVTTTDEMLGACQRIYPGCDGVIGVAAPCDYRPVRVASSKIAKTGQALELHLIETPDVVATLGANKRPGQWAVGFALETDDPRLRALAKLEKKHCDLMVLNGTEAISSLENSVEVINPAGDVIAAWSGPKPELARSLFALIEERLIRRKAL